MEIRIGERAHVRVERQGRWIVLWVNDGSSIATVSLDSSQAFDVATLLNGCGVTAAVSCSDEDQR